MPLAQRLALRAARWIPLGVHHRVAWHAGRSPRFRALVQRLSADIRARDVTVELGAGAGLRFNCFDSLGGYALGSAEPAVQAALQRVIQPGATVYDIGANVGFFSVIAARLTGEGGRVVAFDPLPSNVAAIRHNAQLNQFEPRIRVEEVAVGATDGAASFVVGATPGWGRLGDDGSLAVRVVGLDARIAAGELPVPDVIKLDIEGGEVAALAGLAATLHEHGPVVLVELHDTHDAVRAALEAEGYAIEVLDEAQDAASLVNAHLLARRPADAGGGVGFASAG
jgi:FkbM family methyltransferase